MELNEKHSREVVISVRGLNFLQANASMYNCHVKSATGFCGEFRVCIVGEPEDIDELFSALYDWVQ